MDDLSGGDEKTDLRGAREIVRAMIEGGRARLNRQVTAVLPIIDQPGYPDGVADHLHEMIEGIATMIRHQYLMEQGKTSVARSTLVKRVRVDERRVLEAAYARREAKATKRRTRR